MLVPKIGTDFFFSSINIYFSELSSYYFAFHENTYLIIKATLYHYRFSLTIFVRASKWKRMEGGGKEKGCRLNSDFYSRRSNSIGHNFALRKINNQKESLVEWNRIQKQYKFNTMRNIPRFVSNSAMQSCSLFFALLQLLAMRKCNLLYFLFNSLEKYFQETQNLKKIWNIR